MNFGDAVRGGVRLTPLIAVTLTNYAAQVPYFLHNYYSPQHPLPGLRAVALLGGTLAWFVVGLIGYIWNRRWGFGALTSFLVVETCFYAKTLLTGAFVFQVENPSHLIKAVFAVGYVSGAVAAAYAYRIGRDRLQARSRAGGHCPPRR
jgi:hypothetical protein